MKAKFKLLAMTLLVGACIAGAAKASLFIVSGGDFRIPSLTLWYDVQDVSKPISVICCGAKSGRTSDITVEIDDGTVLVNPKGANGISSYTNMVHQFSTLGTHKVKVFANGQNPTLSLDSNMRTNYCLKVVQSGDIEQMVGLDMSANTWQGNQLTNCIIKYGVKSIGQAGFRNAHLLEYIYIPDSVEYIGKDAFSMNGPQTASKLKYVRLPRNPNFNALSENLFFRAKTIERLVVPSNVTTYGKWVLHTNDKLTTISIGPSTSVMDDSFCQTNYDGTVKTDTRCSMLSTINYYGNLDQWKADRLSYIFGTTTEEGNPTQVSITGGFMNPGKTITLNLNCIDPLD